MKFSFKMEKKHLIMLAILVVMVGVLAYTGAVDKNQAWHAANQIDWQGQNIWGINGMNANTLSANTIYVDKIMNNNSNSVSFLQGSAAMGIKVGSLVVSKNYANTANSPDLYVEGTSYIGQEINTGVTTSTGTGIVITSTAQCPSGKKVIGGGCNCGSTVTSKMLYSNPTTGTNTAWTCGCSDVPKGTAVVAFVICARIGCDTPSGPCKYPVK